MRLRPNSYTYRYISVTPIAAILTIVLIFGLPEPQETTELMCLGFEQGWNGMTATRGVYVQSRGVEVKGNQKFGKGS